MHAENTEKKVSSQVFLNITHKTQHSAKSTKYAKSLGLDCNYNIVIIMLSE